MPSNLWYQKMRRFFDSLDTDSNEVINQIDMDNIMKKFISVAGVTDSAAIEATRLKVNDYWGVIFQGKTQISYKDFVKGKEQLLELSKRDAKAADAKIRSYVDTVFALCDTDKKGAWDLKELQLYMKIKCGEKYDPAEIEVMFKAMDKNKNGHIQLEEFFHAVKVYFLDQEPNISDKVMGPLPPVSQSKC